MTDKRLLCVASMVRKGALLADIGTDHAYLPTYLMKQDAISLAIAADIGEGPAASARRTVQEAGFADVIDVRVCDGLSAIAPDEVSDIVIAGMGGETIIHILEEAPWVKSTIYRLILQPMTKTVELREWLFRNGFVIDEERVVVDGGHIYNVLSVRFDNAAPITDPLRPYIGALKADEESRPYILAQCGYLRQKISGLCKTGHTEEADRLSAVLDGLLAFVKVTDSVTVGRVAAEMEKIAPADLAEEWDNVGLLAGDPDAVVNTIVVALDITPETIEFAEAHGAQMIISHHPVLFHPVNRIVGPGVLHRLLTSGIAAFAAHTNLDAAEGGVNDVLAKTLDLVDVRPAFGGIGRVGTLKKPLAPTAFASFVKQVLGTPVQLHEGTEEIKTVSLIGGGGGEYAVDAPSDAYVTGEMKHHEWLGLPEQLTVVVAGHYATENVVVGPLAARLQKAFPAVKVIPFEGTAPYLTV